MNSHQLAITPMRKSALLGELVLAAYDAAADVCPDKGQASLLAAHVVNHMLLGARSRPARRRRTA